MRVAIVADDVTSIAWHLAAAPFPAPAAADYEAAFTRAVTDTDFVLLSGPVARTLPPATLERARRTARPLVLVVPDMLGHPLDEDLEQEVRRTLGVED